MPSSQARGRSLVKAAPMRLGGLKGTRAKPPGWGRRRRKPSTPFSRSKAPNDGTPLGHLSDAGLVKELARELARRRAGGGTAMGGQEEFKKSVAAALAAGEGRRGLPGCHLGGRNNEKRPGEAKTPMRRATPGAAVSCARQAGSIAQPPQSDRSPGPAGAAEGAIGRGGNLDRHRCRIRRWLPRRLPPIRALAGAVNRDSDTRGAHDRAPAEESGGASPELVRALPEGSLLVLEVARMPNGSEGAALLDEVNSLSTAGSAGGQRARGAPGLELRTD